VSDHPYWAYVPIPNTIDEEAVKDSVDEGRRAFALDLATRESDTDDGHLNRAVKFEAYLRGDVPVVGVEKSEYAELIRRSNRLLELEAGGRG
jgi:hypothetical protein